MEEIWKDIDDFVGRYQVSNFGRVRNTRTGKVLNASMGKYRSVCLYNGDRTHRNYLVHRLVAKAFIGEIPKGYEVHHIDENKHNNAVSNLAVLDKKEHHRITFEENPQIIENLKQFVKENVSKPIEQYTQDGRFVKAYSDSKDASSKTGICSRTIRQVANGLKHRVTAGGYVWKYTERNMVL